MVRKAIFLVLAAIAVGLFVLGTVLTPQPGHKIWGTIYKEHPDDHGFIEACYQHMTIPPGPPICVPPVGQGQRIWSYEHLNLPDGLYHVWAKYEDGQETCESYHYPVTIDGADVEQDIYIKIGDCW